MKIKLHFFTAVSVAVITLINANQVAAQKRFTVSGNIDLVSDYVYRGAYQGSGVSFQPSLSLGYYGVKLNVWGNQSLTKTAKEFDINLSYSIAGLCITVSDLWWAGEDKPYADYLNSHYFEGTIAYTISPKVPLTLSWSTIFAGADRNSEGHLRASTYISASYLVSLPYQISLTPAIGFTPWAGMYHNKTGITDISLKAIKSITLNKTLSLPLSLQVIVSPIYNRTYLIAGISLAF